MSNSRVSLGLLLTALAGGGIVLGPAVGPLNRAVSLCKASCIVQADGLEVASPFQLVGLQRVDDSQASKDESEGPQVNRDLYPYDYLRDEVSNDDTWANDDAARSEAEDSPSDELPWMSNEADEDAFDYGGWAEDETNTGSAEADVADQETPGDVAEESDPRYDGFGDDHTGYDDDPITYDGYGDEDGDQEADLRELSEADVADRAFDEALDEGSWMTQDDDRFAPEFSEREAASDAADEDAPWLDEGSDGSLGDEFDEEIGPDSDEEMSDEDSWSTQEDALLAHKSIDDGTSVELPDEDAWGMESDHDVLMDDDMIGNETDEDTYRDDTDDESIFDESTYDEMDEGFYDDDTDAEMNEDFYDDSTEDEMEEEIYDDGTYEDEWDERDSAVQESLPNDASDLEESASEEAQIVPQRPAESAGRARHEVSWGDETYWRWAERAETYGRYESNAGDLGIESRSSTDAGQSGTEGRESESRETASARWSSRWLASVPAERLLVPDRELLEELGRLADASPWVRRLAMADYLASLGSEVRGFVAHFETTVGGDALDCSSDVPAAAAFLAAYRLYEQGLVKIDDAMEFVQQIRSQRPNDWIDGVRRGTARGPGRPTVEPKVARNLGRASSEVLGRLVAACLDRLTGTWARGLEAGTLCYAAYAAAPGVEGSGQAMRTITVAQISGLGWSRATSYQAEVGRLVAYLLKSSGPKR